MNIPFHKPYITKDEILAVNDVLKKGWLTMGPKTVEFENAFKGYIGSRCAIAMNSCTAALHLALEAIGLKKGDEVIIPVVTFPATSEVVCYFKAKPVFVDIERDAHNIDISKIEEKISSKTKAIIPVHYGGQPADLDEIEKIAKRYHFFMIEDAAHALPAWYKDRKVGTIGDMTCFSFYATKPLACGEGGMVTTENKNWAKRIKIMRLHGISKDAWKRYSKQDSWFYEVVTPGFKYNMTDIQAALGLAQLEKLEYTWQKRREIAKKYTEAFRDIQEIITPVVKDQRINAWHLYAIKLFLEKLKIDRNQFIKELKNAGIDTSVHFIPLHIHSYYRKTFGYKKGDFPAAEDVFKRMVSLPIYPGMVEKDLLYVIKAVKKIVKKFKR